MIWQYVIWALKAILIVLALFVLLNLFLGSRSLTASGIKRGVRHLLKRKAAVFLLAVVFLAVYCKARYSISRDLAVMTVKFNYGEAAKGQNPNKTRFNVSKLLSEQVLSKVIERGNYSLTARELAECLSLKSAFDDIPVDGEQTLKIATEYQIVCGAGIYKYDVDPREMMNLLADVYYEEFLENYTENDTILELSFDSLSDMDYMDVDDYLEMKAQKLGHYILNYSYEDSNYRLSDTGETFSSLAEKITNFIDIELERYRSFVLTNGLSKDEEAYETRMDYENRLLQSDHEKNMASYNVRLEAIAMYDEQMARIVLVPTSDEDKEFYMSRTKIGVDYFADEADQALQSATYLQKQMEHNSYAKEQLAQSEALPSAYSQADEMIESLKSELLRLSKESKQLSDAYISEKRNGYLQMGFVTDSLTGQMGLSRGILYTALFVLMLSACIVMRESGKRAR